ncbi:hypothetical protein AKO1_006931 [Acrasis kona]|uniref:Uncharacterized protein n=1 Tax=Acrasis kona TaxID=1008807 RepID=A0AAW2YUL1_9EUKA
MYSKENLPSNFYIKEETHQGQKFQFLVGPGNKYEDGSTRICKTLLELVNWRKVSENGGEWYRSQQRNEEVIAWRTKTEPSQKLRRLDEAGNSHASSSREEGKDIDDDIHNFILSVEDAIDRRTVGPTYKYAYIFAVHWEDSGEDHDTSIDCEKFCDAMKDAFEIESFTYSIKKNAGVDVWTDLNNAYRKFMPQEAIDRPDDVLIVFYYSGEGIGSQNGLVLFGVEPGSTATNLVEGPYTMHFELLRNNILSRNTHTLFIMDCCCAGLASRGGNLVTEYLCASNKGQTYSDDNLCGMFTNHLIDCINKFVNPFSVEDLYNAIKKLHYMAHYDKNSSKGSIVLKPKISESESDVRQAPLVLSDALFQVEVSMPQDYTKEQMASFAKMIYVEAKKSNFKLEVRHVFHKNSTRFIFHACIIGLNVLKSSKVEIVNVKEIHIPKDNFVVIYEHDKVVSITTSDKDYEADVVQEEVVAHKKENVSQNYGSKRITSTSSETQIEEDR